MSSSAASEACAVAARVGQPRGVAEWNAEQPLARGSMVRLHGLGSLGHEGEWHERTHRGCGCACRTCVNRMFGGVMALPLASFTGRPPDLSGWRRSSCWLEGC